MRIKHFSKGKFYLIECPQGTRVVRCSEETAVVGLDGCDRAGARDYAAFLGFFSLEPS